MLLHFVNFYKYNWRDTKAMRLIISILLHKYHNTVKLDYNGDPRDWPKVAVTQRKW